MNGNYTIAGVLIINNTDSCCTALCIKIHCVHKSTTYPRFRNNESNQIKLSIKIRPAYSVKSFSAPEVTGNNKRKISTEHLHRRYLLSYLGLESRHTPIYPIHSKTVNQLTALVITGFSGDMSQGGVRAFRSEYLYP